MSQNLTDHVDEMPETLYWQTVSLTIRNHREVESVVEALTEAGFVVEDFGTDFDHDCGWFGYIKVPAGDYNAAKQFVEENF